MSDVFVVNPKYTAYATQKSDKMPANRPVFTLFLGIVGTFGIFISLLLLVNMVMGWANWIDAIQNKIVTAGYVTDRREEPLTADESNYFLSYEYTTAEGETFDSEQPVDIDFYNLVPIGYELSIRYYREDPSQSELAADNEIPLALTLLTGIIGGVVFVLVRSGVRAVQYDNKLRGGQRIAAQIVQTRGSYDTDGDFQLNLQVQFTSPQSNQPIQFEKTVNGYNIKEDTMPDDGGTVMVQFVDDTLYQLL